MRFLAIFKNDNDRNQYLQYIKEEAQRHLILLPMVAQMGIDPVHFGLVMMIMVVMGLVTPPVGIFMYTVCSILECKVEDYVRESLPLILTVVLVAIVIIFFPGLALFVPNLIFGR